MDTNIQNLSHEINEDTVITYYKTVEKRYTKQPLKLGDFITYVVETPIPIVDEYRNLQPEEDRKKFKKEKVPAVNFQRKPDGTFNPLMCIDYESSTVSIPDECTVLRGKSIGGKDEFIVLRLPDESTRSAEVYTQYAKAVERYLNIQSNNGQSSDDRCRFFTADPDLFINYYAEPFVIPAENKNPPAKKLDDPQKDEHGIKDLLPLNNNTALSIWAKLRTNLDRQTAEILILNLPRESESLKTDEDLLKAIEDWEHRYPKKGGEDEYLLQYCGYWANNRNSTGIILSTGLVAETLKSQGYCLLDKSIVQVDKGVIYERESKYLYDHIITMVSGQDVKFEIAQGKRYFDIHIDTHQLRTQAQRDLKGNINLIALPQFSGEFFRDTAEDIYFHFLNCTLHGTKSGIRKIERSQSLAVWESQLIKRNLGEQHGECVFSQFLKNISGENYTAFVSTIGYLCRNYNGSDGLRAVWLCDENFEVGRANGRTGKSLFWKALSRVRKTTVCSGKDFQPESQFKFQNLGLDTQVFAIDDVKEKFDFRALYNFCTEGGEYQKKHQSLVQLTIHDTPKVIITANTPPKMEEGASTTGRLCVLPVKPYYSEHDSEGGVASVHGHTFFDGWEDQEWTNFFWFITTCAEVYLRDGLVMADMSGVKINRLKAAVLSKLKSEETAEDFGRWISSCSIPKEFTLADMMMEFCPDGSIDNQAFASSLKIYFDLFGIKYVKERRRINGKQESIWRCV